jgi:hypothetical protein
MRSRSDHDLREVLVKYGAEQALRNYFSEERRQSIFIPKNPLMDDPEEIAERKDAKMRRRMFWDRYALFGQMSLRSAKRPDLRDSISKRKQQAAGNLRCAAFEEDIMRGLKDERTRVDQQFTIDKIIEIATTHNVV